VYKRFIKITLVLFVLALSVHTPAFAAPDPPSGHLLGYEYVNPLLWEFYGNPANQLKLAMPSASSALVAELKNIVKGIGLPVSVAKGIEDPVPDSVCLEVWDSDGWQSGYFLRVVTTFGGTETAGNLIPITYEMAMKIIVYRVA
jgi:hypothetical protein